MYDDDDDDDSNPRMSCHVMSWHADVLRLFIEAIARLECAGRTVPNPYESCRSDCTPSVSSHFGIESISTMDDDLEWIIPQKWSIDPTHTWSFDSITVVLFGPTETDGTSHTPSLPTAS
jgi:hypothetical protein